VAPAGCGRVVETIARVDTTEPPTTEPPTTESEGSTTLAALEFSDEPMTVDRLVVTGGEEVVFDWTTDR